MLSNSVFCMAAFAAFLYLGIRFFAGEVDRRLAVISLAGGLLFSAMTCFGFSLNYTDTIWQPNVFPAVLCLTPFSESAQALACGRWRRRLRREKDAGGG